MPPSSLEKKLDSLEKRIVELEKENNLLKKILLSAKQLKCVYRESLPTWARHYHTDDEFIDPHINKFGFKLEDHYGDIGFVIKIDPSSLIQGVVNSEQMKDSD